MKKLLSLCVFVAFSCGQKEKEIEIFGKPVVSNDTVKEVVPMVGSDEDSHGCKSSAGYTWSELKGECVRVFEAGTQLKPYESNGTQMSAFVIFKGNKAELFVQTEKPQILERKAEGEPFVNGDWQLISWKGYVLKKNGKILFTGQ